MIEQTFDSSLLDRLRVTDPAVMTEKRLTVGSTPVSAFCFTRRAFNDNRWEEAPNTARGLFLHSENGHVLARGYPKFFDLGHGPANSYETVRDEWAFPLEVEHKFNGFLMIVTVIEGELFGFTKSGPTPYSERGMEILRAHLELTGKTDQFIRTLESGNVSVTFEVIDPTSDPHLIHESADPNVALLHVIWNAERFTVDRELAAYIEQTFDFLRPAVSTIHTAEEMDAHIASALHGDTEGVVIFDQSFRAVKVKSEHYRAWKSLRSLCGRVLSGKPVQFNQSGSEGNPPRKAATALLEKMVAQAGGMDELREVLESMKSTTISGSNGLSMLAVQEWFASE